MAVSDKVNIQLEVTGGAVSAQEIDRVNKGLQQMGVDATTAAEVGKKLSQNNKDVKEGLQALALAAAQVSPAAAEAVRGFSALKLAQEGLAGVSKNLGAAWSAVMGLLVSIPGGAIAGLLAILGVVTAISAKVKEWEENQRRAGDAAREAADKLAQAQGARQTSARGEAREIGKIIGSLGGAATAQNIEDVQRRAKLLQENVPTADQSDALRVSAASIVTGTDFNTASKALAAKSFGVDVSVPSGSMSAKDAARYGLELSAGRVTGNQLSTLNTLRSIAPVSVDSSTTGAFSEDTDAETSRRRVEANLRMLEIQAAHERPSGVFGIGSFQIGQAESEANRQAANARTIISNCIINNRNGEATGILGKPSESLTPIGGGG